MARLSFQLALLAMFASILSAFALPATAVADRDCGDFNSQAAAQSFFLNNGGPRSDPHRLDADGDGIACDSNPCPCNYDRNPDPQDGPTQQQPPKPKVVRQWAKVIKVTDGDTIKVRLRSGPAFT